VDATGDAGQAVGTVVDGVHRGDDRQQHLGGADVGGGLLAADVLLPGLQREPVGLAAVGIPADPDQPAGQLPGVGLAGGQEGRVGPAGEQRHAEPLGGADHHVRALLPRWGDQRAGQQVGGDGDQHVVGVQGVDQVPVVVEHAVGVG
jgi:hypothetical protein